MSKCFCHFAGYEVKDAAARAANAENASEINLMKARMNEFTSLPEGSTAGDAELADIRVGWDGTEYDTAGEAVRAQAQERPCFVLVSDPSAYGNMTSNIVQDGFYSITASLWNDLPCSHCVLLVFRYAPNYVVQIAIEQGTGAMFNRIVHRTNKTIYRDWTGATDALGDIVDSMAQFRVITDSTEYDRLTSNIVQAGFYSITASLWDDLPGSHCTLLVFRYSPNYVIQIAVEQLTGAMFNRIVHRTNKTIYRDWMAPDGVQPIKVLALGDSICAGYRNSKKGFVGDLGLPYKNIGVSGATISNKNASVTNIPDQLVQLDDFEPDVIISDGGINDYFYGATMGTVPAAPVTTDSAAAALDRDTVMGAIQYLFHKMITLYPKAQRFFLLTHKTTRNGVDYTITKNAAGYTQTELFENIRNACAVYGVDVIDVFGRSMINTAFPAYVSATAYTDDNTVTNSEFVDSDGVHPLAYGYLHGYVPIVKQALQIGTRK